MSEVTIIDYGLSNLLSVQRAFEHFGATVKFAKTPEEVRSARALVLPGVGAFRDGMEGLQKLGLIEPIRELFISLRTTSNCARVFGSTLSGMRSGSIGRSAMRHWR